MKEIILNIYLVINDGLLTEFRAKTYEIQGSDEEKIFFLKSRAVTDFESAEIFESPSDKYGKKMSYNKFYKLEKQGMQFTLFENIFDHYNTPEKPLVCVTPVQDGNILADNTFN